MKHKITTFSHCMHKTFRTLWKCEVYLESCTENELWLVWKKWLCVFIIAFKAIKIGKLNCFSQHLATIIRSISLSVSELHYTMITLSHKVLYCNCLLSDKFLTTKSLYPTFVYQTLWALAINMKLMKENKVV